MVSSVNRYIPESQSFEVKECRKKQVRNLQMDLRGETGDQKLFNYPSS